MGSRTYSPYCKPSCVEATIYGPRIFMMADPSLTNGRAAMDEMLGRLSRKPGFKAGIVLDRTTGSILKTTGDLSALRTSKARDEATAASFSNEAPAAEESESKG